MQSAEGREFDPPRSYASHSFCHSFLHYERTTVCGMTFAYDEKEKQTSVHACTCFWLVDRTRERSEKLRQNTTNNNTFQRYN
jgi:hypothetical protein